MLVGYCFSRRPCMQHICICIFMYAVCCLQWRGVHCELLGSSFFARSLCPRLLTLPASPTVAAHPCTPSLPQFMNNALPEEAPGQPLSELELRALGQRLFGTVGTVGAAEEPVEG